MSLKAHDGLLLLCGAQGGSSGELLTAHTRLGELLAGRLQELYSLLAAEDLDPAALQSRPHVPWRYVHTRAPCYYGNVHAQPGTSEPRQQVLVVPVPRQNLSVSSVITGQSLQITRPTSSPGLTSWIT